MKGKDCRKGDGGAHVIRAADLPLSDCTRGLMVAGIERCIIVGAEGRALVLESCSIDRGDSQEVGPNFDWRYSKARVIGTQGGQAAFYV
jgi:hypothetical protein